MTREFSYHYHHADFAVAGRDGEVLPGMIHYVESCTSTAGDVEGVKQEQQVPITQSGFEVPGQLPFDECLLS